MQPLKPSFLTLLLMISFASINAVFPTPALPEISHFFAITENTAQQIITWFLIGYALGQLIYGPLANRFGRKPALYAGISLQILSSLLCIVGGIIDHYWLLVLGRFLTALGSGVGLKMTFTIINECYAPQIANKKISYLTLSFAVAPGLSVALGGLLSSHYGWQSCFIVSAIYGLILLLMVTRLPETKIKLDLDAFKINQLLHGYITQLKDRQLITGAILLGGSTCFIYVFSAVAPFLAMNIMGMTPSKYGMANIIPSIGLMVGSIFSAKFSEKYSSRAGIGLGIFLVACSSVLMMMTLTSNRAPAPIILLFIPTMVTYFGVSLIISNASTLAMSKVEDKSHGAAVMSFINVGTATAVVLVLSLLPVTRILLPTTFSLIALMMLVVFFFRPCKRSRSHFEGIPL